MNDGMANTAQAINIEALRERYRIERDRRTPDKAARAYLDMSADFSDMLDDPYTDVTPRAPVEDEVDVLVVGGGFGGLMTAARLREAGVKRIRLIEAGGDVGGTWYWNRYPGAACDVESYVYFPLLEETGYMPRERYSKAAEILEHSRRIARHFDLYDLALFSTQVTSVIWDDSAALWRVETNRGDRMSARFVVLTTGPLNKPKLPAISGIESFAGHSFHTSRWDYDYTGGSATEPMTKLADKRVAIIGTGATAIQCVPPLGRDARQLYVFQRTPSSVDARNNSLTDPEWAAALTPGWQQRRIESFTAQFTDRLDIANEVGDGWTALADAVRQKFAQGRPVAEAPALLEEADFEKMAEIRQRIDGIVQDKDTAEALKPWFSLFCKRPCFHDDYLPTFNRENVTLVDTQGLGIERITEKGLVVDGKEYEVDCIIYATGFDVSSDFAKRAGFDLRGADGITLRSKWRGGMSTLHGMHVRGFPNLFFISQAQSGMSVNFPHMLSVQSEHIAHIVARCMSDDIRRIEASEQAEQVWTDKIVELSGERINFLEACTPGYYNNEGGRLDFAARSMPYGGGPLAFTQILEDWREQGEFDGLELDGKLTRKGDA
ncbi:NAD(P)/FAD-dependent oxidoreductase [Pseudomonas sp. MYb185]|uniref:flavin-containing monooxygenase n=1 Tax=Pseudomonas sp. MYb185 TaxID=1848729 RepID=UPI000CFB37B1|nr:NAD(P)/FAD-dependent oxidoreductase [Pseudomonas sp. MYb185]PRB76508.1 monooxygenase [Pseudomonas sp. MYb185]